MIFAIIEQPYSLGLQGSKTFLTDRPRGVRRLALTVRDIAKILPNVAYGEAAVALPLAASCFSHALVASAWTREGRHLERT